MRVVFGFAEPRSAAASINLDAVVTSWRHHVAHRSAVAALREQFATLFTRDAAIDARTLWQSYLSDPKPYRDDYFA
jgi:hypothetical protein